MLLPFDVQEKIKTAVSGEKFAELKKTQKSLTEKYKTRSGDGRSLIDDVNDSKTYLLSRMPATYAVCLSLFCALKQQGFLGEIKTAFDVGSGTGAGFYALREFDENIEVSLFERDSNMLKTFKSLEPDKEVENFDLAKDDFGQTADLVMTSFVLSELGENERILAAKKLFDASEKYLLIIDTGTPKVWKQLMNLKSQIELFGGKLLAPCRAKECSLKNDYCQFFARVERSSLHKQVKNANLSYEDEKYFYLLFSKEETNKSEGDRIIRRPVIKPNTVSLLLCTENGVIKKDFSKKDKNLFKKAKKSKINNLI